MNPLVLKLWNLLLRFPLLGTLACLGLLYFTGGKLGKMAQIEGWIPGASSHQVSITDKGTESGRRGEYFWVSWDPNRLSDNTVRLEQSYWQSLKIGDTIEVRQVPGDEAVYAKNDVFTEPGNHVFDLVLLLLELVGTVFFGLKAFKRPATKPIAF